MSENDAGMYWLHALTPLHVGSGRGLGYIDLPLIREKTTNWPYVPASALKGVLADKHGASKEGRERDPALSAAFGRGGEEHSNSGSLVFTDARMICLPVRSFYGTFAWCSSPMALSRLLRDLQCCGLGSGLQEPSVSQEGQALVPDQPSTVLSHASKILFEDLDFVPQTSPEAARWAQTISEWVFSADPSWQQEFRQRFCILADNVFDFLSETGTDVTARVCLSDETKTVDAGPWYEESLPAESILAGLAWCDKVFQSPRHGDGNGAASSLTKKALLDRFCRDSALLQVGGNATVGRGRLQCHFTRSSAAAKEGLDA